MAFDLEDTPCTIVTGIISLVLSTVATILILVPGTKETRTNTLADEPTIMEMAGFRHERDKGAGWHFEKYRDDVIDELYTKSEPSLHVKFPRVLYGISAFFSVFFFIGLIQYFWAETDISAYYREKAKYWKNRSKKEHKILDDLIALQLRIEENKFTK